MSNTVKTFFRFRNINHLECLQTHYRAVAAIQRSGAEYHVAFAFYSNLSENHKKNPYSKEHGKKQALERLNAGECVLVGAKGVDIYQSVFDAAFNAVFLTNTVRPGWLPQKLWEKRDNFCVGLRSDYNHKVLTRRW